MECLEVPTFCMKEIVYALENKTKMSIIANKWKFISLVLLAELNEKLPESFGES